MAQPPDPDRAASPAEPPDADASGPIDVHDRSLAPITRLTAVMARLRDPEHGCPWDLEQDFATIVPHTIEEAHEVADAIENGDLEHLREELGDLLFQVVFYAQLAHERGLWDFEAVAAGVADKMLARHPHVFGDREVADAGQSSANWEADKAAERAAKAEAEGRRASALDGVSKGLPALTRALKLQRRAARVGFDWTGTLEVLDKIEEEVAELRAEITAGAGPERQRDELGDLFFALVNLARRLDLDPEGALRQTNGKFERRFRYIEQSLEKKGSSAPEVDLDTMEALWQEAKAAERR
ncbi:MAG: nucleoside triphosphate pyrophosphohydrolase [Azospirillaceae bacterium]